MSLRTRIMALIGLVLLVSVLMGSVVAGLEARRTLHDELRAALAGGQQTALSAFEDLPRSDHPERDLRQLVATFDGNRHLSALLLDRSGRPLAVSAAPGRFRPAPAWFARLLGSAPGPIGLPVPAPSTGARTLSLEPTAGPDVAALWREFSGEATILLVASLAGLGLVHLVVGAAVRPLHSLSEAFGRIGEGDYGGRVREQGPPELVRLERAFNGMAAQLAAMQRRNAALETQLAEIQDEERADLARDLHDEIGPHLFSVNIDAQIIGGLVGSGREAEVPERLRSIQSAVAHMQRLVREILTRLRPTPAAELGLNAAIDDLVAFWKARRPEVEVALERLPEERYAEPLKDTVYRVVQEALANAMRHGEAGRIEIRIAEHAGEIVVRVADDGVRRVANPEGGYGLIGMRERVRASHGVLTIDTGEARGGGWVVTARLPAGAGAKRAASEVA